MAPRNDWIPTREGDLLDLIALWQPRLTNAATQAAYGWVAQECTATNTTLTAFLTARTAYETSKTHINRLAKDRAKKDAIAAMRKFANERIRFNTKMPETAREEMGIHARDTTPTPVPPPTAQAEADIDILGVHLLALHLHAVPGAPPDPHHSDYGYRIYYGVMPPGGATPEAASKGRRELIEPPLTGDDLPHSRFTRRQKEQFDFPADDSGKTVYFCVRFENAKGEPGPWGPLFHTVIP
ncbi:MAG: hypothetical protein LBE06_02530 [Azoarcus sp.]|jgi:hypothetical protein|nr:hypothetical protein [Azoarcus sp.]